MDLSVYKGMHLCTKNHNSWSFQRSRLWAPLSDFVIFSKIQLLLFLLGISSIQDFDALYPETGVSFGPTICSFGLPYNDHNYALPVGLTPPTMAPHLMDVNFTHKPPVLTIPLEVAKPPAEPKSTSETVTVIDVDENGQDSSLSRSLIKTKGVKSSNAVSSSSSKVVAPPNKLSPLVFASIADSTACLSESKKTLFAAWHAKAAASGGTLLVQQRWKVQESDQQSAQQQQQAEALTQAPVKDQVLFSVPRYCKSITKESEGERVYLESDMKVSSPSLKNWRLNSLCSHFVDQIGARIACSGAMKRCMQILLPSSHYVQPT